MDKEADGATYHISVHFQRTNDTEKDRRRLRRIHRTFTEFPGADTFSIIIETPNKPITMTFANKTTGCCEPLLHELESIVGEGNVHIKPLA
jgi:hypothetical protein